MKETLISALDRLGVTRDQFCELAAISLDDLDAINSGASLPTLRVSAILRLIKGAGRAKVVPIVALLKTHPRQWLTAPGFPAYEVSDDGFVRRHAPSGKGSLRTLKPILKNHGYLSVTLYRDGKPEPQRIHRLVCEAFHGPAPIGKPFSCHRDGTRTNNSAANLYWGSATDNSADWQIIRRERIRNAVHRPYTAEWRRHKRALESIGCAK